MWSIRFHILGTIDDVRICPRALSLAEIQADMNTPWVAHPAIGTPPSVPADLTATRRLLVPGRPLLDRFHRQMWA